MLATVFKRARGWISDWARTLVCGAEAFDDAAHERPDIGRSDQHRRFAVPRRLLEFFADQVDEFGQLGGLHGKAAVVALADDGFGESLLPFGGERDQRQIAVRAGVLGAELAREPRADMLGQHRRIARDRQPSAMPSRMVGRSRIETRSASRICSTRWMPER